MPFPGVYSTITDKSFSNGQTSRFTCGLLGVASRGPFNSAINVIDLPDYVAQFGQAVAGNFLAQAVASVTPSSDGAYVVRIGRQYAAAASPATGTLGGSYVYAANVALVTAGDYVRVSQAGKNTTVNARVQSASSGTITLVSGSGAVALADTYTAATVANASTINAANKAEGFLTAPTYGAAVTLAGTVTGSKSQFQFSVSGDQTVLAVGDVIKIVQTGAATTREACITAVRADKTVTLQTTTNTQTGVQAISLQDNYATGTIFKVLSQTGQSGAEIQAATDGTWANAIASAGVRVNVGPGSAPDTKKFLVYLDGALAATYDNLSTDPTSANYYVTLLAGSSLINVVTLLGTEPPGNTILPWGNGLTASNNLGLANGYNGENVSAADYVGTVDQAGVGTGLKVYDDRDTFDTLYVLCAPGVSDAAVLQEIARVAGNISAVGLADVPDNIGPRDAIDWTNAAGVYSALSRLDTFRLAYFWNWFQSTNPFTGLVEYQPPTVGVLGAMARVFNQYKPWYATAGSQRGQLPGATAVRYPRIPEGVKQQMLSGGNVVNPILFYRRTSIEIYGDATTQRTDSKLTALHTVNLINTIIKGMSAVGRRYVFEPNDPVLLQQLDLEFRTILDGVLNQRGIESYNLSVTASADDRNNRRVITTLNVVPVDVMLYLYINAIVNESGAQITSVLNGPAS